VQHISIIHSLKLKVWNRFHIYSQQLVF